MTIIEVKSKDSEVQKNAHSSRLFRVDNAHLRLFVVISACIMACIIVATIMIIFVQLSKQSSSTAGNSFQPPPLGGNNSNNASSHLNTTEIASDNFDNAIPSSTGNNPIVSPNSHVSRNAVSPPTASNEIVSPSSLINGGTVTKNSAVPPRTVINASVSIEANTLEAGTFGVTGIPGGTTVTAPTLECSTVEPVKTCSEIGWDGEFLTISPECCALPYTNGGKLYFGCVNESVPYCWMTNGTQVHCTQPADYEVKYIANNISIPTFTCTTVLGINNWIIIQQRIDDTVSFDQHWKIYEDGFGDLKNIWLGLKKIFQLTSNANYQLRFEIQSDNTGKWYSSAYSSFQLGHGTSYAVNVSGYAGDAMDSFAHGTNGGTFYAPRGSTPYDCAKNSNSGWWFNNYCNYKFNLNTPYGDEDYFAYEPLYELERGSKLMRTCRMMIRAY